MSQEPAAPLSDRDTPSGQDTKPVAAGPDRRRRRLLLGAAGVLPSVYTLSSGAQVAVASNLRCLSEPTVEPPRFVAARDNWLRAPIYMGQYEGRTAYCVTNPQESCMDVWHPGQAASGSEWLVDGSTMTAGAGSPVSMAGYRRQYGLIYVDRDGTIAALDPSVAADIHPATTSCWASVMASWNSKLG